MSIKYEDLNPVCSSFRFQGKDFELRPFDLAAQVWAHNEFATKENKNGVEVLSQRIQDTTDFEPLLKCAWHLLKRKRHFGFYDEFVKQIDKGDDESDKIKILGEIYRAFVETLGVSQPQLDTIEEELELKKPKAAESLRPRLAMLSFMIFSLLGMVILWMLFTA